MGYIPQVRKKSVLLQLMPITTNKREQHSKEAHLDIHVLSIFIICFIVLLCLLKNKLLVLK